jgi:hypothetical protein
MHNVVLNIYIDEYSINIAYTVSDRNTYKYLTIDYHYSKHLNECDFIWGNEDYTKSKIYSDNKPLIESVVATLPILVYDILDTLNLPKDSDIDVSIVNVPTNIFRVVKKSIEDITDYKVNDVNLRINSIKLYKQNELLIHNLLNSCYIVKKYPILIVHLGLYHSNIIIKQKDIVYDILSLTLFDILKSSSEMYSYIDTQAINMALIYKLYKKIYTDSSNIVLTEGIKNKLSQNNIHYFHRISNELGDKVGINTLNKMKAIVFTGIGILSLKAVKVPNNVYFMESNMLNLNKGV